MGGEAGRLGQVVDQLLSNALKFTPEGRVSLALEATETHVCLTVEDTGVGMAPAYLDTLFTPFSQEDSRVNRQYEGTGLGLALVKRLLDLMGGAVSVESEQGEGTTFTVWLPIYEEGWTGLE